MSQRINSYFNADQGLRQLSRKATQLAELQRHYEHIAPSSLTLASHVVQLAQQTLVIAANNSATAAKLRQLSPELAQRFRDSGHQVTVIQVRVQVSPSPPAYRSPPLKVSSSGQQKLIELAGELPDSPLKTALQRLARK